MNVKANNSIEILDVGPRDGLQNDPTMVSTDNKIALIERLIDAGIKRIEVGSFVHPKAVPQMADTEEVVAGLPARNDVGYIGLIMNERGLLRALDTRGPNGYGINEVGCVVLTSDTFGQKNQGQTAQESVGIALGLLSKAKAEGMRAQVTISAAFGCPFEGKIPADKVIRFAEMLADADPVEIAIADSIGVAGPQEVEDLFAAVAEKIPHIPLRGHFHNTRNTGLANVWAAVRGGASTIDASIGGIGGCPFAPAATGNVPTEDVVYMLERSGVETGVDLVKLIDTAKWVEKILAHKVPSMVSKAGLAPLGETAAA